MNWAAQQRVFERIGRTRLLPARRLTELLCTRLLPAQETRCLSTYGHASVSSKKCILFILYTLSTLCLM